jgi:hypothetical protein
LRSYPKSHCANFAGIHYRTGYPCRIGNFHRHHHSKLEACDYPRDFQYHGPNHHDYSSHGSNAQQALESKRLERVHYLQRNPSTVPELELEQVRERALVAVVSAAVVVVLELEPERKNAYQSPHRPHHHRLPLQSASPWPLLYSSKRELADDRRHSPSKRAWRPFHDLHRVPKES